MADVSGRLRAGWRVLTRRGELLLGAGLATVIAAVLLGDTDLLRIGLLFVALPAVCAAAVLRSRFRLASSRRVQPRRIEAGQEARVIVTVDNIASLPTGLMLVEDRIADELGARPRFVFDRLEPQGRREVEYRVRAAARGRYRVGPLQVTVADPFRMAESRRSFTTVDTLVVTPVVDHLPGVPLGGDWAGAGDSRSRSVAAAGDDDVAIREYRHGDELRRVHWRATAKFGELMVRREEQPWESRCTLLLDLRRGAHRGAGAQSSFERAVSAAASIAIHLSRRGYTVRLATPGLAPGGDAAAAAMSLDVGPTADSEGLLLDVLATAEAITGDDFAPFTDAMRSATGTLLVAVTGHLCPEDAAHLAQVRSADAGAVAVVLDVADWLPGDHPDRARLRAEADGSTALLRSAGWRVALLDRRTSLATAWGLVGRSDTGAWLASDVAPATWGGGR
jgi:uncharacterized protein (DUF58 family)